MPLPNTSDREPKTLYGFPGAGPALVLYSDPEAREHVLTKFDGRHVGETISIGPTTYRVIRMEWPK